MTTQPPPPRTEIEREIATAHGLASFKEVPYNRAYALDDQGALGLAAIAAAYAERQKEAGAAHNTAVRETVLRTVQTEICS